MSFQLPIPPMLEKVWDSLEVNLGKFLHTIDKAGAANERILHFTETQTGLKGSWLISEEKVTNQDTFTTSPPGKIELLNFLEIKNIV